MVSHRHPPAYWNSYRPSYDGKSHPNPQRDSSPRWSPGLEANSRSVRGSNAVPLGSRRERPNRSRSPSHRSRRNDSYRGHHHDSYRSRREDSYRGRRDDSYRSQSPSPAVTRVHNDNGSKKKEKPELPWPADLDDLMSRTARALDLVVNYERDSDGGVRWAADAIQVIRSEGKKFHSGIANLKAWAGDAERAKAQPTEFEKDVKYARNVCNYVQHMIGRSERNSKGESLYELEKARG
ncbi:hypothetical protein HBI23_071290 [Parastagonospora nodorum]|nr:hypothetical protein HBI79_028970 [Parastagonospora nodorum]KAH5332153.1 hypothetical protein HBI12_051330 [Parastagonospora nodorum]KAH5433730.1 hypothetical protein HBI47_090260 [Parastagonospora nodorum]KAH5665575.1 hypothetical protein HBI23_071290 [Parastagonospora nodorum]KAH6229103.1 hypothetical protein HBI43_053380 [Parastagonospora nodorum]